ncbi:MAG: T9SS C-terminal target domain-containing protein, partial [Flavobacteriia bacterium]
YQDIYLGLDAGLSAPTIDISFYPNPASEWCYFQTATPFEFLEIIDANGRVVLRHENVALQGYFDISALPNGTYTVRIQAIAGVAVKKLVKL